MCGGRTMFKSNGALAVRRVGNMDVLLRHQLQSGSRIKTLLNRFKCDVDGCVLGQMLPENAKTIWPIVEDVLHGPDVTAGRQALIDNLHDADGCRVLSLDGTMKIAMGLRRYETMILHREERGRGQQSG